MKGNILILLLLVSGFCFGQVPNTNTFDLDTVVSVVNPTTSDLQDCINDAIESYYDPAYYTSPATSLLEFRNYGIGFTLTLVDSISISETSLPNYVSFDTNETKMYVSDIFGNTYQYSLSTAGSVSTATYDSKLHNASEPQFYTSQKRISSNGNYIYGTVESTTNRFVQWNLTTSWDISTASTTADYSYNLSDIGFADPVFIPDGGERFIYLNAETDSIFEYNISTANNISSISGIIDSALVSNAYTFTFNFSGDKLYVTKNEIVYLYETTNHSITGLNFIDSSDPNIRGNLISMWVSNDDSKLYIADNIEDKIYEYDITY